MNGSEHYREAERYLAMTPRLPTTAAYAQAHAALAQVALTAEIAIGDVDPELWLPAIA